MGKRRSGGRLVEGGGRHSYSLVSITPVGQRVPQKTLWGLNLFLHLHFFPFCFPFFLPTPSPPLSPVQPVASVGMSHDVSSPVLYKYRWGKSHRKEKGPHELKAKGML